jgi:aspartyl protease family protein
VSNRATESAEPRSGKSLRLALLMLALTAVGALAIGYAMRPAPPTRVLATPRAAASVAPRPRPARPGRDELTFRAASNGHFFVDAEVNGTTVHFMVDTGASYLSLTPKDAAAIGLLPGSLTYNVQTSTAHGVARNARVRLREVRLAQLSVEDVTALVMEDASDISLLGMSFLSRLDGYRIRDGVLTLEW